MQYFLAINPKLPTRNPEATKAFYSEKLGFTLIGDYGDYLLLQRENVEIHFFLHQTLVPQENYGQVYIRVQEIESLYKAFQKAGIDIHPNAPLQRKPWGQREFSLLDPDFNLLTFGEEMNKD
jgi:catechol 2,3-dioxygenase-like lactoylglutathione lyase family enzyme